MTRETAEGLCTAWLREQILAGDLAPGDRIRPEAVAAHLGVSRMPVREALRLLDAEGLVTLRPNRGAIVTRIEHADLIEIFEMRAVLEGLCVRHAALRATPADIDELDNEAQAVRRVLHDRQRWSDRNEAFHNKLCALGGLPRASGEARRLRTLLRPTLRAYIGTHPAPEANGHEHEVILDALRDRDAARAERLAAAHVTANGKAILGHSAPLRPLSISEQPG